MGESTFPNPHDKDIRQVEEGLGKRAVYDSTNQAWKLPTGKNAAIGEWIWVNGQIGQATAAIVGGTDAIVEGTNWTEDTDGALNALNSKINNMWKPVGVWVTDVATAACLLVVSKGTDNGTDVALSLVIPVASLDNNTLRYWMVGDSYNGNKYYHLQIYASKQTYSGVKLYADANEIQDATFQIYYM